jgi:hypothetical protein
MEDHRTVKGLSMYDEARKGVCLRDTRKNVYLKLRSVSDSGNVSPWRPGKQRHSCELYESASFGWDESPALGGLGGRKSAAAATTNPQQHRNIRRIIDATLSQTRASTNTCIGWIKTCFGLRVHFSNTATSWLTSLRRTSRRTTAYDTPRPIQSIM